MRNRGAGASPDVGNDADETVRAGFAKNFAVAFTAAHVPPGRT